MIVVNSNSLKVMVHFIVTCKGLTVASGMSYLSYAPPFGGVFDQ